MSISVKVTIIQFDRRLLITTTASYVITNTNNYKYVTFTTKQQHNKLAFLVLFVNDGLSLKIQNIHIDL